MRPPREHTHGVDWFGSSLILSLSCRRCSPNAPSYGLLKSLFDAIDARLRGWPFPSFARPFPTSVYEHCAKFPC
jgi:hypothetical protein